MAQVRGGAQGAEDPREPWAIAVLAEWDKPADDSAQKLLHVKQKIVHPLIEGKTIQLEGGRVGVVAKLDGVNRQDAKALPLVGICPAGRDKTEQPPQVMGQRWVVVA